MWKVTIYKGDELILDHRQNSYDKTFRFAVEGVANLHQNGAKDFRVIMTDKEGNVYFSAIGEETQIVGLRKKGV